MSRLLLVDDDLQVLGAMRRTLQGQDWDIRVASSGEEALAIMGECPCEVVCSDAEMPGMKGIELLSQVRERWPNTKRLLFSGRADVPTLASAINDCGIFRFLRKPWGEAELREAIADAFECYVLALDHDGSPRPLGSPQAERGLHNIVDALEAKVEERTRQLSRARHDWELTFDTIPNPGTVVGADYVLRRANLAAARLTAHPVGSLPGQKCHAALFGSEAPCQGCPIGSPRAGPIAAAEISVSHSRIFAVQTSPLPDGSGAFVCTYNDVTERESIHQRAIQREKMVALGQLAGGIAHEINNPLAGVLALFQLLADEPGRSESDAEALQMIETSVLRCKRIIDSMLKFSRGSKPSREGLDVVECIRDSLLLFEVALKTSSKARLVVEIPEHLPEIMGDAQQLEQVLMNLLQNGLQALPERAGTLTVKAGPEEDTVFISVSDTGSGIRPEHLPFIFDAAFTTKPAGEGTGFGLAIVRSIVDSHGGKITVDSQPGRGTTFKLNFPCTSAGENRAARTA
ncbi:MAG: ATP-binding protein [Myxococcaceae bacterium]